MTDRAGELVLTAPDPKRHAEAIYDLTGKCFAQEGYYRWLRHCREAYFGHANYDWSASTVGLLGGKVVTHWGVWGYRMRIGTARVRTAGIGAVATDGTLRRHGLMRRTAAAGVQRAAAAGYDVSVLFGIHDFYHRFGYVLAWPHLAYAAQVSDLPRGRPACRATRFRPHHRDDLADLYNRANAAHTGTAVRPTHLRCDDKRLCGYLWHSRDGHVAGYLVVRLRPRELDHVDSCGETQEVLRHLRAAARRSGIDEVRFPNLHYRSSLAEWLRRTAGRLEMRWRRSGGAMVRTLNLAAALAKMTGELSRRLRRSHLADWRGGLLVADPRQRVLLAIADGRVRIVPPAPTPHAVRGGEEIARLLIGADEPQEVVAAGGIRLAGDARKLVPVLFPNEHPVLNFLDRF